MNHPKSLPYKRNRLLMWKQLHPYKNNNVNMCSLRPFWVSIFKDHM